MHVLMLLIATVSLVAGSVCIAGRLEAASRSRQLLLVGVLVPAQITATVLVVGWLLGEFHPAPMLLAALLLGGIEVRTLWGSVRWEGALPRRDAIRHVGGVLRRHPITGGAVAIAGSFIVWQSVRALRLPVTSWDSLSYHLPEPSTWVLRGRVGRSGLTHWGAGYPQGQEVLHGWTMVFLHSIRHTGLVPLWLAGVAALAIYRLARSFGTARSSAVLGAAVFLTMPAATLQIGTAYVDLGGATFALAAVALALEARVADEPFGLFLGASAAAALAVACKPSLAPVVLAVAAVGHVVSRGAAADGAAGSLVKPWAACTAVVGMLGGVWYATNYLRYGNPLYPVTTLGWPGVGGFGTMVRGAQIPEVIADQHVVSQVWFSWITDLHRHEFNFDQRLGGLGAAWVLLCVPSLMILGVHLWRRDRTAFAVLTWVGVATWASSGSMWWARYSLVLAGIGCAALALVVDRVRASGAWRGHGAVGLTLVLVAATVASAVAPSDLYALDQSGRTMEHLSLRATADTVARGNGERVLRPWAAFTGLAELPPGRLAVIATDMMAFPQVFMGADLDRELVKLDPPPTAADLIPALDSVGARLLVTPADANPGSVESIATADALHFRPIETKRPITGYQVWELGRWDACVGGRIAWQIDRAGTGSSVTGTIRDACGPIRRTGLELWRAGTDDSDPWPGAARLVNGVATDANGRFSRSFTSRTLQPGQRYFVVFPGESRGGRYRPPQASKLKAVPR